MTSDPHRPSTAEDPGQVEILDRDVPRRQDGSVLRHSLAGVWSRLGRRTRALTTGAALLAGLAVLTLTSTPPHPRGEPSTTTAATASTLEAAGNQGPGEADARVAAVASWLQAQHAWAASDLATLCRSFTGLGAVDPTLQGLTTCTHMFSPAGALLGLDGVGRPQPGVQYRPDDAFALSDQRTVLVYGRRVRSGTGRALDQGTSVVYVMRLLPRFGWRWVGTTDAETSIGWVPAGFPPVRP